MKIKKTLTDKVIAANRENGKKGIGPKTERGKEAVSRNAVKHGILVGKLHLSDQEAIAYQDLMSHLKRRIDPDDPFQSMLAQELGATFMRRGRAFSLENRSYKRQNPATEIAFNTIENSELVNAGVFLPISESGWDCTELQNRGEQGRRAPAKEWGGKQHYRRRPTGPAAREVSGPMEKALRYQRATAKDSTLRSIDLTSSADDGMRNIPNKPTKCFICSASWLPSFRILVGRSAIDRQCI